MITKSDSLITKKFNMLTILGYSERTSGKRRYFICQCDCGEVTEVRTDQIKSGHTKSCGCLKKSHMKKVSMNNVVDLTGATFGWLTVIKATGRKADGQTGNYFWLCKCKCGKETEVRSSYLKNSQTVSCGCYHKERIKGINNPNFKPKLTIKQRNETRNFLYGNSQHKFRKEVLKVNGFTCDICKSKKQIVAHHLDSYNSSKHNRFDSNNGVALCLDCHKKFHRAYGYGNNTKNQYKEFKEALKIEQNK